MAFSLLRRAVVVACLVAAWPAAARAQADVETDLDAVTEELTFGLEPLSLDWHLGAQAFAGVDGGRAAAGVTAGGALVVPGPKCRFVDVGAQGALHTADASPLSGQAWASLCGSHRGQVDMHLEIGDRALLWVEPALTTRRLVFHGTTSGNVFSFEWVPIGFSWGGESGRDTALDFWHFDMDFQLYWSYGADDFIGVFDFRFDMVRWWKTHADADREVTFVHVDVQILGGSDVAGVFDIVPLRLRNLHLGGGLWDAEVAWTRASNYAPLPPGVPPEEQEPVHELNLATAHLGARWPRGPGAASGFDLDRDVWATLDRGLVRDTRAAAWTTFVPGGDITVSAKGFVAFTETFLVDGGREQAPTYGGELRLSRGLGHGLVGAVSMEGARLLNADPTAATPFTTARVLAVLSATMGK